MILLPSLPASLENLATLLNTMRFLQLIYKMEKSKSFLKSKLQWLVKGFIMLNSRMTIVFILSESTLFGSDLDKKSQS